MSKMRKRLTTITMVITVLLLFIARSQAQQTVNLTLAVNDTSWGTTSPAPGVQSVNANVAVSIKAIAATGYEFSKWTAGNNASVADENAADTTVTLSKSATVTAIFTESGSTTVTLTMAVNDASWGTTSPTPGSSTVSVSETVTISASPYEGYEFSKWSAGANVVIADEVAATTSIVLTKSSTVTAIFAEKSGTADLEVSYTPVSGGTTSPAPGTYTYTVGDKNTISATAASGYSFLSWVGAGGATVQNPTNSTTTVTLTENGAVKAVFVPSDYEALTLGGMTVCVTNGATNKDKVIIKKGTIPTGFPTLTQDSVVTVFVGGYAVDCSNFEINEAKGKYVSSSEQSDGSKVMLRFDTVKGIWDFKAVKANGFDSIAFNVDPETLRTDIFIYLSVDGKNYGVTLATDEKTTWKFQGVEDLSATLNVEKAGGKFKTNTDIAASAKKDSFKINKGTLGGLTLTKNMFRNLSVSVSIDNLDLEDVLQLEQPNADKEVYKGSSDTVNGTVKMKLKLVENTYFLVLILNKIDGSMIKGPDVNIKLDIGTVYRGRFKASTIQKTTLKYKAP